MDRSSNKGKKFWGEHWWAVLHSGTVSYNPKQPESYPYLIDAYKGLLPCPHCRDHFKQVLAQYPVEDYLGNSHQLLFWSYLVHDLVNKEQNMNKPANPQKISPPFKDVLSIYTSRTNWNEHWWFVLHSAAAAYSPEQADSYLALIKACLMLMPKRRNLKKILGNLPVERYLRNNQELFFWSYAAHDMERRSTKSKPLQAYIDFRRYYFSGLGEECKSCNL